MKAVSMVALRAVALVASTDKRMEEKMAASKADKMAALKDVK
jgi:hypothetical protein